jgi:2-oxoglutarate ferredoxin oxidoreductase subunit gamma
VLLESLLQLNLLIWGVKLRKDIRIAGFGGQGIILAGIIIGRAASLFDGIFAVQTQSYGPEARGGASRTEVVISDGEIDYPKVQNPDIFVAMSHEALMAYLNDLKEGGTLIVDPGMIDEDEILSFIKENKIKYFKAPATEIAVNEIGIGVVANIVMLGAVTKITKVVSEEAVKNAILESVPKGTESKNLAAFEAGAALFK